MGGSSVLLLHLGFPLEETMTHFLCQFKHFHGPSTALAHLELLQRRNGQVRLDFPVFPMWCVLRPSRIGWITSIPEVSSTPKMGGSAKKRSVRGRWVLNKRNKR